MGKDTVLRNAGIAAVEGPTADPSTASASSAQPPKEGGQSTGGPGHSAQSLNTVSSATSKHA